MKVKSINYQKTFNLGNYSSERIGVEIDLIESKFSAVEALDEAKIMVEDWHKENNPELFSKSVAPLAEIQKEKISDNPKTLVDDIMGCKTIEGINGLLTFKAVATRKPEFQAAYDLRFEQLSQINFQKSTN